MNIITLILNSNLINFIIVAGFLVWVIKKVDLAGIIAKKGAEIAESVKNSEDEKKIKQNHLGEIKVKVSNVREEAGKIVSDGEQIAKSLSDSIGSEADKHAEDLHNKALIAMEHHKQLVTGELTAQVAGAAFYIAEEHIKQAMDDRLHSKYIDEFIENLSEQEIQSL